MELHIGEKIREHRRERNLTQEEVAAHLGVSFQSISKWERSEGYPDITLLPALARYFGVTVDELLGTDEIAARAAYEKVNLTWEENNAAGLHAENVRLLRGALKQFPNDPLLLVQLAASLEKLGGTDAERIANLRESIALQEQILRYGTDPEISNAVRFNICFSYMKNGQRAKAIACAEKLPNLYKTRENALVHFLEGSEKRAIAKSALQPLTWALALHLSALAEEDPSICDKRDNLLTLLNSIK